MEGMGKSLQPAEQTAPFRNANRHYAAVVSAPV
jgi:hypothetical protein